MVHIAESEWMIMKVLWAESPLSSRQIIDRLEGQTDWNDKTVHTLISRLCKKEAIRAEKPKGSNFYQYFANVSEKECTLFETKNFLKRLYSGSLTGMVSAFVEGNGVTKKDIRQLRDLLEQYEKENGDD